MATNLHDLIIDMAAMIRDFGLSTFSYLSSPAKVSKDMPGVTR